MIDGERAVVALPRYRAFTQAVFTLLDRGVRFEAFAGNGGVMLTAIAPRGWTGDLQAVAPGERQRSADVLFVRDLHYAVHGGAVQATGVVDRAAHLGPGQRRQSWRCRWCGPATSS